MAWSKLEVEATVSDYLHMLVMELSGQSYNKSSHRKALLKKLTGRTEAAIERKHQNISAILIEHGYPYISGYKPLGNYQLLLKEVVEDRLASDSRVEHAADAACSIPAAPPLIANMSKIEVEPPKLQHSARDADIPEYSRQTVQKRDYLAREARNASLGLAGEEFVITYEHFRLRLLGKNSLADKVEHVSRTKGDGLGFDILSFDVTGRERFIEVKTTAFGKETPFFLSSGELKFGQQHKEEFHLYRLFDFRRDPRLFDLRGSVEHYCRLDPATYICRFS